MPASLGDPKPEVKHFLNGAVYADLNMEKQRAARLQSLIASRFNGDRAAFGAEVGLTKGRVSQLLKDGFGERSASSLASKLGLPERWFEDDPIESLSPEVAALAVELDRLVGDQRQQVVGLLRHLLAIAAPNQETKESITKSDEPESKRALRKSPR